jgi:hypothetical protein
MERVPESELDPGEDGTYWTRGDEPFTGVVFSTLDGQLSGEWGCRDGFLWGPERHYSDGELAEARYNLAGHPHGFRRQWSTGGRKYLIEEYQLGVKVRSRWWKSDGTVVSEECTVGPEAEETARYVDERRQEVEDMGGDPGEVPGPYVALTAGEWDDPPAPGDAGRWLARFPHG